MRAGQGRKVLGETSNGDRDFKFSPAVPAAGEADDRPPPARGPIRVRPRSRSLPHLFLLPPTIISDFPPRSFILYSIPDADNLYLHLYLNLTGPRPRPRLALLRHCLRLLQAHPLDVPPNKCAQSPSPPPLSVYNYPSHRSRRHTFDFTFDHPPRRFPLSYTFVQTDLTTRRLAFPLGGSADGRLAVGQSVST